MWGVEPAGIYDDRLGRFRDATPEDKSDGTPYGVIVPVAPLMRVLRPAHRRAHLALHLRLHCIGPSPEIQGEDASSEVGSDHPVHAEEGLRLLGHEFEAARLDLAGVCRRQLADKGAPRNVADDCWSAPRLGCAAIHAA